MANKKNVFKLFPELGHKAIPCPTCNGVGSTKSVKCKTCLGGRRIYIYDYGNTIKK